MAPSTRRTAPVSSVAPNPIARAEDPIAGTADHRNLYCGLYGECLAFAARSAWRDWSCEKCTLNVRAKAPGATQWAQARIRLD